MHNREGGRKRKTNNYGLGLAPSARREKSVTFWCSSPVHLLAIAWVYSRETPTKPLGMLTHLLALVNLESIVQRVLAAAFLTSVDWSSLCPSLISWLTFSRRLSPTDCSLLLPSADCVPPFSGTFLPSSTSGLVGDLAYKPFV